MRSDEILATRKALGWSQSRLAEALGVSVRTVKHWEAGTRNISEPAARLLQYLNRPKLT